MNTDRLIRMIFNRLFRKAVTKGVDAGAKRLAGNDPQAQKAYRQSKQMARRARQAQRITKRLGKF